MATLAPDTAPQHLTGTGTPQPTAAVGGLGVHVVGDGPPLLLMPNPQGMVGGSESCGSLARLLTGAGWRVITFDPPGAFASSALRPRLDLAELTQSAGTALSVAAQEDPLPVIGHSHGSLAALALVLDRPEVATSLVLIGAVDGGIAATRRAGGLPFNWSRRDPDFWRFVWLGAKLSLGRGTLADYKKLRALFLARSYADARNVPRVAINAEDRRLPPPARAGWQRAIRALDLRPRLNEIGVPTLVCAGRHDPQTPVAANGEIANAVRDGRHVVFEHSGHYPFEEEPELFLRTISAFLERDGVPVPADVPLPPQAASALRATTTSTVSASNA